MHKTDRTGTRKGTNPKMQIQTEPKLISQRHETCRGSLRLRLAMNWSVYKRQSNSAVGI
ncbi:hypothetical protein RSAG8_06860, partial [Rhizoctonia solani AG-8 WAC10335]